MKKFLTIGSMCDLVGDENNTKYLIIGYKKKKKDYEAVLFPGGTTGKNPEYKYFNADEVDEIYDLGYKDQVAIDYVNDLFSKKETDIDFYDESSVVPSNDSEVKVEKTVTEEREVKNYDLLNKIKFDENGVVISDESAPEIVSDNISSNIKFDENGIVISDGIAVASKTTNTFKFDQNGVVISDGKENNNFSNSLKFDENGVVISDGKENNNFSNSLKFDENGVVISDGIENNSLSNSLKFDENGVVIAE